MSMELHVAIESGSLPSGGELMQLLKRDGIEVVIDGLDWSDQHGFLPMTVDGRETGVEVDLFGPDDADGMLQGTARSITAVKQIVSFRWSGDSMEAACGLMVASALARLTSGWIYFADGEGDISPDEALSQAREAIAESKAERPKRKPAAAAPRVTQIRGDLLDQQVDVIVNPWNRNIIPWWLLLPQGVSGAIKKRGGTEPFRELAKHGSMPLGSAVVTGAGRLPFSAIIHVAGINMFWRSSERAIRDCTRKALGRAREWGFKSIAFPIIGAGSGGFDRDAAKRIMLDEISKHHNGLEVVVVEYEKTAR